jgi:hypothetical protein
MSTERVNIQYSIDIEQLPQEVARLIEEVGQTFCETGDSTVANLMEAAQDSPLSLNTVTQVDVMRKKLASLDYVLSDVSNIINGYLTMQVQKNLQQRYDTDQIVPEAPSAPTYSPEVNGET